MNGYTGIKIFLALVGFLAQVGQACAQAPVIVKEPLPSGPLVGQAPKNSAWTVTVTRASGKSADQSQKDESGEVKVPEKIISVTKSDPIRLIKTSVKGGVSATLWCVGPFQIHYETGLREPILFSSSAAGFSDFSKNDFPELDWISKENYQGILADKSRKYLVFSKKESFRFQPVAVDPGAGPPPLGADSASKEVEHVVYIDLESRLPFLMLKGADRYTYQFDASPPTQLILPDEARKLIEREETRLKRLSARPPAG